jgi:hypothetical protein
MDPCDKGPEIKKLQENQNKQDKKLDRHDIKLDQVLESQVALSTDIKDAINGLTKIIMADVETRAAVEQGKKERELLFNKVRDVEEAVVEIKERNAKCDGAGIFENFPKMYDWYTANIAKSNQFVKVYDWYLGELGWRRFFPTILTIVSFIILLYVTFGDHASDNKQAILDEHHKAESIKTYGLPK